LARIRTIKPAFFRHEALYEAEIESRLPLRVAYAGLWTASDREGRFKWRPRELKLDCLPYDDVDFSRVLDALTTRGFVVRYVVEGVEYGFIPSFTDHQIINNREAESDLPNPNDINALTRAPRVDDACATPLVQDQGEGKGRERKEDARVRVHDLLDDWPKDYRERFWEKYPHKVGKPDALRKLDGVRKRGRVTWAELNAGLDGYIGKTDDRPWCNPATWLNQERWADQPAQSHKSANNLFAGAIV
jgi:hypothetical protein